jgi:hypothetical protein
MKQLILILPVVFLLSACKKEYNCHCVTTVTDTYNSYHYNSSTSKMKKKMTKDQAQSVCDRESTNATATYTNFITNNGNWSSNGINVTTGCTVE